MDVLQGSPGGCLVLWLGQEGKETGTGFAGWHQRPGPLIYKWIKNFITYNSGQFLIFFISRCSKLQIITLCYLQVIADSDKNINKSSMCCVEFLNN
jgi:hypothetical protein